VCSNGDTVNDDEADVAVVQGLDQRAEVELAQRAAAAPLTALICLHSECTRASLSLIVVRRSASKRMTRALARSSISPLSRSIVTGEV
jgi:hypothetical protein